MPTDSDKLRYIRAIEVCDDVCHSLAFSLQDCSRNRKKLTDLVKSMHDYNEGAFEYVCGAQYRPPAMEEPAGSTGHELDSRRPSDPGS